MLAVESEYFSRHRVFLGFVVPFAGDFPARARRPVLRLEGAVDTRVRRGLLADLVEHGFGVFA